MLEPFIWMFKNVDFKSHFMFLLTSCVILYILAGIFNFVPLAYPVGAIFIFIAGLLISGYFWNLTEEVIAREFDITSDTVYNGKIRKIYKIELPRLKFFQMVWRGFASIVASFFAILPYAFIIFMAFRAGTITQLPPTFLIFGYVFYCAFFPALFWNYAKNNSVVSTLNFRKAIFIMGNYTFRYIACVIGLIVVNIISSIIDSVIYTGIIALIPAQNLFLMSGLNVVQVLIVLAFLILMSIKAIYIIFVNAYLLGSIAPAGEC